MSSFTENGISVVPPIGSIMAYMGRTSPDGWIICDGEPVYNTDSKYQELIDMGIGSVSGTNYYTPPDLKGCFLQQGTVGTTGGNSTATLSEANMPSHTHTVTIPDHTHQITVNEHNHSIYIYDGGHTHPVATTSTQTATGLSKGPPQVWGPWANNNNVVLTAQTSYTGITASANNVTVGAEAETVSLTPTVYSTGSGTAFDILPPFYNVNYILKH
jgi:microcystin-dependent protein